MYKKKQNKYKGRNSKEGLEIEVKEFSHGLPQKEVISTGSEMIQYRAFKDLSFNNAIEVRADPNAELASGSYPYAILARTNRVTDAQYPGQENITGNSLVRLQNSVKSQFLNLFDSITMVKRINYLYCAYDENAVNKALNVEFLKAIEQALSYGYSTMLTQLPFYTDYMTSELPRIGALLNQKNDTYDRLGVLLHYQIVMQNIVSVLAKYTELLSMEPDLMDMSYRREAPLVQQIFGQLKKAAFKAQLNGIGSVVLGEYFDLNWYKQINTLRHIPSRRANDMHNPLITMVTTHEIPHVKLYSTPTIDTHSTPYYDSKVKLVYKGGTLLNPETFKREIATAENGITLENIVLNLGKLLDAHYLLSWCRQKTTGNGIPGGIARTSEYYQSIVDYVDALNYIATQFSSHMTEVRTFLDKLANTNMLYWKKGVAFNISKVGHVQLTYNQIVADVLKSTLAGAASLTFDSSTQRWTCFTPWNMYTGINKFDQKSGGSFLAFSNKIVKTTDSNGVNIDSTSSVFLIPIVFSNTPLTTGAELTGHQSTQTYIVTRLGLRTELLYKELTNSELNSDRVLSRLNPLLDTNLSIKAPNWDPSTATTYNLNDDERKRIISSLHKVLVEVAGYDRVTYSSIVSTTVDPDLLCFVDLQIEDVSNAMIQYARNYSPFRVSTPNPERTMGFGLK